MGYMKKQLKKWHLYFSLGLGGFILLISISGALLTFGKEIQRIVSPQSWVVEPQRKPIDVKAVIAGLQILAQQQDIKIKSLYLERRRDLAWQARMSNGEQWNINPHTGEVTDRFAKGSDFYSVILHLHRWLLFSDQPYRDWVRHLISIAASVFILQIIIGTVLWLKPRKSAIKRLKIKRHKKLSGTLMQWHLTAGVVTAPILILIAYCGIGFNWPVIGKLVEWSTGSHIEKPAEHKLVTVGGMSTWPTALVNAQQALPAGHLQRIYFPQQKSDPLTLRFRMPAEFHPFSYVWLDGGSGQVLGSYDASQASTATRIWNFKYKFHIGDFAGLPIRIAWLLLSLLPMFFVVSGLWVWWCRHRKSSARERLKIEAFREGQT